MDNFATIVRYDTYIENNKHANRVLPYKKNRQHMAKSYTQEEAHNLSDEAHEQRQRFLVWIDKDPYD